MRVSPSWLSIGIIVAVALAGIGALGLRVASDRGTRSALPVTHRATALPEIVISATDFSFAAPVHIDAGPIAASLANNGQQPHHAIAFRLNDGVSPERFLATLPDGPEAALAIATVHGGPQTTEPGATSRVTLDLSAGQYVFLCLVQDDAGVPHAARGMVHPLDVTQPAGAIAAEPRTDVRVGMEDFDFAFSAAVPPGRQTWEVANHGAQPHELALYTLLPDKTFDDLAAYAQNPTGPRPVARVGGVELMTAGARTWLDLDLRPGGYALVCTIVEPATGREHVDLGMLVTFSVAAAPQSADPPSGAIVQPTQGGRP